jgi:hypothetical protein
VSYSQPAHGQQPYPYSPHSAYPALREHPEGTTILILGVLGFVVFPCGIIAWYLGSKAMKQIQAGGIRYSNESNITTGKILGMVTSIIGMVAVGLVLVQIVGSVVFWLVAMVGMATI